jgi:hypothetical protein
MLLEILNWTGINRYESCREFMNINRNEKDNDGMCALWGLLESLVDVCPNLIVTHWRFYFNHFDLSYLFDHNIFSSQLWIPFQMNLQKGITIK